MANLKLRALAVLLIAAVAFQAVEATSSGRALKATIIRAGYKPFDKTTTIVCRNNRPYTNVRGVWTETVWVGGLWYPLTAITDVKLLGHDSRSCAKITHVSGPMGGGVTTVHKVGRH